MIGQNDKLYHVGAGSGFDDANRSGTQEHQTRINGL